MDSSISNIATILFGEKDASNVLKLVRPAGQPLVEDWDCLKMLVSDLYIYIYHNKLKHNMNKLFKFSNKKKKKSIPILPMSH